MPHYLKSSMSLAWSRPHLLWSSSRWSAARWLMFNAGCIRSTPSSPSNENPHTPKYACRASVTQLWNNIWAMSWENLFMPYANNKGADQPAHPCSLIRAFVVCCPYSIIPILAKSKISRLQLVCVAEQASLSLTWSEIPKTDNEPEFTHR